MKGLALALGLAVTASAYAGEALKLTGAKLHEIHSMEHAAEGRPNEEARLAALKAHLRGDHAEAAGYFRRAAHYADKYSQHALSLVHWHGIGVAKDRVQAYIWADLAAERGTNRLLLVRERMWQDLTPGQRGQVATAGPGYYARYGDAVAQPRAEAVMRRFASRMAGSRVGYDGQMLKVVGAPQGGVFMQQTGSAAPLYINSEAASIEELYGESRRNLTAYWTEQDRLLNGRVDVGSAVPVRGRSR